jgi:hypothetical protein
MGLSEPVTAEVEVGEEGLPDWLTEVEEETPMGLPEPVTAEVEVEEEGLPDWLIEETEPEEVTSEPAAAPAKVEEAEPEPVMPVSPVTPPPPEPEPAGMPDWLKKLRESHEEAAPQPVAVPMPQAVTYVQPVVMAATPEPVAPAPAKLPAGEPDKLLELARTARNRGNIKEAAPLYDTLISSGVHLDSVIEDMRQSVKADPSNYLLYQIMGDAMMKDGRLQNALDAYRQALVTLSK